MNEENKITLAVVGCIALAVLFVGLFALQDREKEARVLCVQKYEYLDTFAKDWCLRYLKLFNR